MGVEHIEEIGTTVDKWGLEKFQLCSRLRVLCLLAHRSVGFAKLIRAVLCQGVSLPAW